MKLYCPKFKGELLTQYVNTDNWAAWCSVFDVCYSKQDHEWRRKYWKQVQPFREWARKNGYEVVTGEFVEDSK